TGFSGIRADLAVMAAGARRDGRALRPCAGAGSRASRRSGALLLSRSRASTHRRPLARRVSARPPRASPLPCLLPSVATWHGGEPAPAVFPATRWICAGGQGGGIATG